jgi:hypothetical protein
VEVSGVDLLFKAYMIIGLPTPTPAPTPTPVATPTPTPTPSPTPTPTATPTGPIASDLNVEYEVSTGHFLTLRALSSETGASSRFGVRYDLELRNATGSAWNPGFVAFDATNTSTGIVTWPCVALTAFAGSTTSVLIQTILEVGVLSPVVFVLIESARTSAGTDLSSCRATAGFSGSHTFDNIDSSFASLAWAVP